MEMHVDPSPSYHMSPAHTKKSKENQRLLLVKVQKEPSIPQTRSCKMDPQSSATEGLGVFQATWSLACVFALSALQRLQIQTLYPALGVSVVSEIETANLR